MKNVMKQTCCLKLKLCLCRADSCTTDLKPSAAYLLLLYKSAANPHMGFWFGKDITYCATFNVCLGLLDYWKDVSFIST